MWMLRHDAGGGRETTLIWSGLIGGSNKPSMTVDVVCCTIGGSNINHLHKEELAIDKKGIDSYIKYIKDQLQVFRKS